MKNMIRGFRRLALADIPVFASAIVVVLLVRLALWLMPSRVVLRFVSQMVETAPTAAQPTPAVRQLGWAVRAVSRRVPRAHCLTQALATQILLARRGSSSLLRIGVARDTDKVFAAHAWVEIEGGILVGGSGASRFKILPELRSGHYGKTIE
jgi:hypothetical protein